MVIKTLPVALQVSDTLCFSVERRQFRRKLASVVERSHSATNMSEGIGRCASIASFGRKLERSMMLLGEIIEVLQNLVYGPWIALEIVSTLLHSYSSVDYEKGALKVPKGSPIKVQALSESHSTYDISTICRLVLTITGKNKEDHRRQYTRALKMTKACLKFKRAAEKHTADRDQKDMDRKDALCVRSTGLKSDKVADKDVLDPDIHAILVKVMDYLTMWIVYIGLWMGERLPMGFIMVIEGPKQSTQYVAGLDSGSSENLIRQSIALELGLPMSDYEGPILDTVGGSVRPLGCVTLKWRVSNRNHDAYKTNFIVLEDSHCKGFGILVGNKEIDRRRFFIRNPRVYFVQAHQSRL